MAARLSSSSLLPSPAPLPGAALGSCQRCAVRRYCALYAPLSVGPPADCPFGPGPGSFAATRK